MYFCLVFQLKYVNIPRSRHIYLRSKMTSDIKSCLLNKLSKWSKFMPQTTNICQWCQKNQLNSKGKHSIGRYVFLFKAKTHFISMIFWFSSKCILTQERLDICTGELKKKIMFYSVIKKFKRILYHKWWISQSRQMCVGVLDWIKINMSVT